MVKRWSKGARFLFRANVFYGGRNMALRSFQLVLSCDVNGMHGDWEQASSAAIALPCVSPLPFLWGAFCFAGLEKRSIRDIC